MLLCRFNVTSRKLTTCLFASMVIRSPLRLNIWQISFLMFSVCLGVALVKPYYVTAKQTFNYAKYTKNVNFKLYSINVTVVNILFINKSPEERVHHETGL